MKDLKTDIDNNYTAVQRVISRMELDLLPPLLKNRKELLAAIDADRLDELMSSEAARELFKEAGRQNALIQARIRARMDVVDKELKTLYRRAESQKAYRR